MIYRVRVVPELIEQMVREGHVISARCVKGLPEGAMLWTATIANQNGASYLVLRFHVPGDGPMVDLDPVYENLPVIRGGLPVTRWDQGEPA